MFLMISADYYLALSQSSSPSDFQSKFEVLTHEEVLGCYVGTEGNCDFQKYSARLMAEISGIQTGI